MFAKYQNESKNDRLIRIIAGALITIFSYLFVTGFLQLVLLIIGIILVFTGLTGFCLIYKLLGIKTKK